MITFGEVKDSRVVRVAAACPDSDDFAKLVNDATRELMYRGSWYGTLQFCNTCVWGDVITWNRYVGTVLDVNINGRPTQPFNLWYDFTPPGTHEVWSRVNTWIHRAREHGMDRWSSNMINLGTSPVVNQPDPRNPNYLQFSPTTNLDLGKTITVFGLDDQNQQVITKRSDGTIQPGEVITIKSPSATSQKLYKRVDRVLKDPTQGRVNGFLFDPILSTVKMLAIYEPGETNPQYVQSRVPDFRSHVTNCGGCSPCTPQIASALVKVQFVPVFYDTDLVQIDNLDALAQAVMSIRQSDAFDHQGAEAAMSRAVHTLNHQLKEKFPIEQTTVSFRPFGTATLSKLYLGMQ